MNRLIIWRNECDAHGRITLTDRRAEHIRTILKCTPGDTLRAGFANETMATGTVISVEDERCVVEIHENPDEPLPPPPTIDLLLALPRPRFLERILPQLPPLGVRKIFLCGADRVEKSFFGSQLLKKENYLPVLVEGVEQGGGIVVPDLRIERNLRRLLQEISKDYECKLVAHPTENKQGNFNTESTEDTEILNLKNPNSPPCSPCPLCLKSLLIAIGCEGGWADRELTWMDDSGFQRFSLGERILRTDTACIAVLAVLDYLINCEIRKN